MNVNPIDLQVLFSKASEHAANLGRGDSVKEAAQYVVADQMTKKSVETTEVVHTLNPSEEEGNKIEDNPGKKNPGEEKKGRQQDETSGEAPERKRAMLDEKSGKIVDIID